MHYWRIGGAEKHYRRQKSVFICTCLRTPRFLTTVRGPEQTAPTHSSSEKHNTTHFLAAVRTSVRVHTPQHNALPCFSNRFLTTRVRTSRNFNCVSQHTSPVYVGKLIFLKVIHTRGEEKCSENFSGKPRRKIALGRPRRRWRHNVKLGLKEIRWESVD